MVPSQFVHRVARGPGLFPMPRFLGDGDRILTTFCRNKKLISWNGFQAVQQIVPKKQQLNSVFFWRDVIFLIFSRWNNHYKHDHQKPITRVHSIPETVCKWAKLKGAGYASEPKNFLQVLAAHSLKPTASLPLKIGRSGQILVGNFIFQLKWFFCEFFAPRTFRSQNARNNYLGMSRPGG